MSLINDNFKKYFPELSNEFELKDFQKKVINNVVLKKQNTLSIMQTGGGKSLIYWLSGLSLEGITIVVSPLIALIDEQADKLEKLGFSVLKIHASMSIKHQNKKLFELYNKELNPDFIFVSPERLATDGLFEFCIKSRKEDVQLFVIDEVHCISQWGFSFRPFYKRIPSFINNVFKNQKPIILGLTATINPKELLDISKEFDINQENILKDNLLMRQEIELIVNKLSSEEEKEQRLFDLLEIHKDEKILVYLYRKYNKRGTEDLMNKANEKGFKSINFHGDMSSKERQEIITKYKNDDINIIFATNAFGMGIDIPDIRVVIHFMIPESVEQYYQEIGRSARDGNSARTYLFYSNKNIQVKRTHFIDKSFPSVEKIIEVYQKITKNELGFKTLFYFDDEEIQKSLPYLLENHIIKIHTKGFSNLKRISEITNEEIQHLYDLTKTKNLISTIKKSHLTADEIFNKIYKAYFEKEIKVDKFDKCLIIENLYENISDKQIESIQENIRNKQQYKHELLDYFIYLLNNYTNSKELHQEIGLYLGANKFDLNKIHTTQKGDLVRSKSEVIIANMLYTSKLDYEYEKEIIINNQKLLPDFAINYNGTLYYWEHLGLIGVESYDKHWIRKKKIYDEFYKNQLIVTYESSNLTDNVEQKIRYIKQNLPSNSITAIGEVRRSSHKNHQSLTNKV